MTLLANQKMEEPPLFFYYYAKCQLGKGEEGDVFVDREKGKKNLVRSLNVETLTEKLES